MNKNGLSQNWKAHIVKDKGEVNKVKVPEKFLCLNFDSFIYCFPLIFIFLSFYMQSAIL